MKAVLPLALGLAALAGCAGGEPATDPPVDTSDCREGDGAFFLVVLHNKDFYGSPEEVAKDRFHTVDREGRFFGYVGTTRDGTGQVLGDDGAFVEVTRGEVLAQLQQTGQWNASRDYQVQEAWRAAAPAGRFGALCQAVLEESDPPSQEGSERVSCADGGTRLYRASTREGGWERTLGCLHDASKEESESSQ